MPLQNRIFTDARRWPLSFPGIHCLQRHIPGNVGKDSASYQWFRTGKEAEVCYMREKDARASTDMKTPAGPGANDPCDEII